MSYSKKLMKICSNMAFGLLLGFSMTCLASVPHTVDKYGFHIELPDGFTKVVVEEVPYQRVYDSYHGNHNDNSFIHIKIQKQDVIEDWTESQAKAQLEQTVAYYKSQGVQINRAEFVKINNHNGLLIYSQHNGKEHLSQQIYCNGTMYIVSTSFDNQDKHEVKDFMPMMKSIKILSAK